MEFTIYTEICDVHVGAIKWKEENNTSLPKSSNLFETVSRQIAAETVEKMQTIKN